MTRIPPRLFPLRRAGALVYGCMVLLAMGVPSTSRAEWPADGAPVCTAVGGQTFPMAVHDGAAGVYFVWKDDRQDDHMPPYDVYVQHLAADGALLSGWPLNGIRLADNAWSQVAVAPDAAGGLYVAWEGSGIGYPYLQRITPSGTPAPGWPPQGLVLCSPTSSSSRAFALTADGVGGVFAVWSGIYSSDYVVLAQHVSPSGQFMWASCGVPVSTAVGGKYRPIVMGDGAGGMYAAWQDYRGGLADIYAQHLDAGGSPVAGWGADGNVVGVGSYGGKSPPVLVPSGNDGMVIIWSQRGNEGATPHDIFGLRLTAGGEVSPGWEVNGTPICSGPGDQTRPYAVTDDSGGAFVFWEDDRSAGTNGWDVYASRIASDGTRPPAWPLNGLGVCTEFGDQRLSWGSAGAIGATPAASDGAGGAYVTWSDSRAASGSFDADIYFQRLGRDGVLPESTPGGDLVCDADLEQSFPSVALCGGDPVVVWIDYRDWTTGLYSDIYASKVPRDPTTSVLEVPDASRLAIQRILVGPGSGDVSVEVVLTSTREAVLELIDVMGRRLSATRLTPASKGPQSVRLGNAPTAGVYFTRLRQNGTSVTRRFVFIE